LYYGSEQAFAGPAQSQIPFLLSEGWKNGGNFGDRYLREAMFGPEHPRANHGSDLNTQVSQQDTALPGFGPFGTFGKHCFDPKSPAYVRIAALSHIRAQYPILRIGRQYARQTRIFSGFNFPNAGELVAWSRILDLQEAVCIINPNGGAHALRGGDVIVSSELWSPGTPFTVVANTAQTATEAQGNSYTGSHPIGSAVAVKGRSVPDEPAYIEIRDVFPAEVLVLIKEY
jgi:hypothetical protein